VELDIQRTHDGHLVLMHDKFVERTTNGTGAVSALSWDEIQQLNAGNGERVPSLGEALSLASGRVGLMLESITPGIGAEIHQAVCSFGFNGPVIFSSFLHADILAIRKIDSSAKTMALLEGIPVTLATFAAEADASHVGVSVDSITDQFVKALHDANLQVFVYTVNDPKLIEFAKSLGVDGITSDCPDRI
jgi:glycerophosphoryl diester phosphodiesterase